MVVQTVGRLLLTFWMQGALTFFQNAQGVYCSEGHQVPRGKSGSAKGCATKGFWGMRQR